MASPEPEVKDLWADIYYKGTGPLFMSLSSSFLLFWIYECTFAVHRAVPVEIFAKTFLHCDPDVAIRNLWRFGPSPRTVSRVCRK